MIEDKICMYIMAHWINNSNANASTLVGRLRHKEYDRMPRCLREDCGMWVETDRGIGHCGVINEPPKLP